MKGAVPFSLLILTLVACGEDPAAAQDAPDGTTIAVDSPAPGAPEPRIELPVPEEIVLDNGVRLWMLPDREVPLVNIEVRVDAGAAGDGFEKAGRAALLAEMLRRGAGERDARAFEAAIDVRGGEFSIAAWPRETRISCEFLAEDTALAIGLVGDVLTAPRFDAGEFAKARQQMLDRLAAARDAPNRIIDAYWRAWMHPHDWGVPASGTELSLASMTLDDVKTAFRLFDGDATVVAVAGAFDPEVVRAQVRAVFGKLPARSVGGRRAVEPGPIGRGVLLVDKPDALQTYMRFGGAGMTGPTRPIRPASSRTPCWEPASRAV